MNPRPSSHFCENCAGINHSRPFIGRFAPSSIRAYCLWPSSKREHQKKLSNILSASQIPSSGIRLSVFLPFATALFHSKIELGIYIAATMKAAERIAPPLLTNSNQNVSLICSKVYSLKSSGLIFAAASISPCASPRRPSPNSA